MKTTKAICLLLTINIVLGISTRTLAANTPAQPANNFSTQEYIRLQLAMDAINTDDTYIGFSPDAQTQYVLNEDAQYFQGYGKVNLSSISSDGIPLAINKLPLPGKQSLTINLDVEASADGIYKLNLTQIVNIPQLYDIWLIDNYKKDSVDMRRYKTYEFNVVKSEKNSYGSKRFSLVIRQDPALSVHLLAFTATKASTGAQINWTSENEEDYTNFTVEKSINDGVTFDVVDGFVSSGLGAYSFLDSTPPAATSTSASVEYRLKIEDLNGTISYSDIATLKYENSSDEGSVKNVVSVYPNPAIHTLNLKIVAQTQSQSGTLTTQSSKLKGGAPSAGTGVVYSIKIYSNTGAVIKTETTSDQDWTCDVSNLLPGAYIIQILNNSNKSFVGTTKFIKQ